MVDSNSADILNFTTGLLNFSDTVVTEIIHYFKDRDTSGFVEGFNNKVKVLKRRCYGLASGKRLFQRLIIDTKGRERFAPGVSAF